MPKKRKFNPKIPPCPGDPNDYKLYRGKYRYHWQRKRGSVKPAKLNSALQRSADITGATFYAAKHMMSLLSVFTQQMDLGITTTRVAGRFKKSYMRGSRMDFSYMDHILFQEDYPIYKLFDGPVHVAFEKKIIRLTIGAGRVNVKPPSRKAVSYQFHAILLHGDPLKNMGIKIETTGSRFYSFDEQGEFNCDLTLPLRSPKKPWVVLLHIGCQTNDGVPPGPRYHAMWFVEAG